MAQDIYQIGIMMTPVEEHTSEDFGVVVKQAVEQVRGRIAKQAGLQLRLFNFSGPHLTPTTGGYAPLDFLRIGLTEKLDRSLHFLLVVTEVDLTSMNFAYVLAFPSQITNVGIVSTKRLNPAFWGDEPDRDKEARRLSALLMHTFGHLLNLRHDPDAGNAMYDFEQVEDLDRMGELTGAQVEALRTNLPREARDRATKRHRLRFALRQIGRNWWSIWHTVKRANPFVLISRLPTMITAGLSVVLVFFFSPEIWDVASTVEAYQLGVLALLSISFATMMLYQAFRFGTLFARRRTITESTVATVTASALSLLLAILIFFSGLFLLFYLLAVTIFPRQLMATWPTVDPAVRTVDHLRLALFLASMGALTGSLGGRADSKDVIRRVLFLDEES
jgi:hypothetical protein